MDISRFEINDVAILACKLQQGTLAEARACVREMAEILAPGCMLLKNEDGAPYLECQGKPSPLHISISHSRKIAAVAISSFPIGIDVEEKRDALLRVKTRFLTEKEQSWISDDDLLYAWTIKEAVYKAAGIKKLTSGEIEIEPSMESVSAAGRKWDLSFITIGESLLTLSY